MLLSFCGLFSSKTTYQWVGNKRLILSKLLDVGLSMMEIKKSMISDLL